MTRARLAEDHCGMGLGLDNLLVREGYAALTRPINERRQAGKEA